MTQIPDHIQIKLSEADEIPKKALDLCCKYLVEPNDKLLTEISVRIGTMANIFRSALNNVMWDFAERGLLYLLQHNEYNKLQYSHDYPIEKDKNSFESSKTRILRHLKEHFPQIFDRIEQSQPYHQGYSLLWTIKVLSNATHTIPIKVIQPNISAIALEHGNPKIFGDKVFIPVGTNKQVVLKTPCFIEAMDMFVSKDGKWKLYLIDLDQDPKFSVTGFIGDAYPLVKNLISELYTLFENQRST